MPDLATGSHPHSGVPSGRRSVLPGFRAVRPHRAVLAAGLLAAPPVFHVVGADLLTATLLLAATALQLRSRAGVVDRLVLAGGLLLGWVPLLGVLASAWPWGLNPPALAEVTALPLAALVLTRPRPARLRMPVGDWLLLLVVGAVGWFYLGPLLTTDATGRLAALYHGEDLARHFALYDSVLRFGGYLTFHRAQAAAVVQDGFQSYPQGSHLTLAVLTGFARNGDAPPDATTSLGMFLVLTAGALTAFVAAVLWAVRRAAGPALGNWAVLPLCVTVAGYLVLVEATPLLLAGFESEIFGLALFALLTALVLRPLGRTGEQLLLLGALTVGLSFSYYLLLGAAVPLLMVWAVVHRRRWLPARRTALAAAVLTGAAAALPVAANWPQAGSASVLAMPGGVQAVTRHLLLPLLAVTVLGLLTRAARRNAVRRAALAGVAAVGALTVSLQRYQVATTGHTAYYYEKVLHQLVVVTLIALGAALVPVLGAPERRRTEARWPARAGWSGALAVALLATVALNSPPDNRASKGGWQSSSGAVYRHGEHAAPASAALIIAINATRPVPDPRIGVVLVEPHAGEDPRFREGSLWLGVLARDNGRSWRAWIWGRWRRTPQQIVDFADASPEPLRVYLDDTELASETQKLAGPERTGRLDIALVRYDGQDHPVVVDPFGPTSPPEP